MSDLLTKERIEIDFWRDAAQPKAGAALVRDVVENFFDVRMLSRKLEQYAPDFARAQTILELGGGTGLAACLVKLAFPDKRVYGSDISPAAVEQAARWEGQLGVRLDRSFACRSYEVPLPDASVDLIFAFKAAHHFAAHRRTLAEAARVLRPGGACLYLYEPACPRWIHPAAHWRVNRKRPAVPEDVLIYQELERRAAEAGLSCETRFDPSTENRGFVEQNYYYVLSKLPLLCRVLPSTADFVFRKP